MTVWDAELVDDTEVYLSEVGQIAAINEDGSIDVITGNGKIKINITEYEEYIGMPNKFIKSIRKRLK
jgi:hypothetical protein